MPAVQACAPTAGSRLWIQWTLSNQGRLTIVSFAGEIDLTNADQLVGTLLTVLEAGTAQVVLDLSGVTFLDLAGGRALVAAQQHAASRQVRLDVVCASDPARAVLELGITDDTFGLHRTVTEALSRQQAAEPQAAAS
jgi:anti-sigma B factor antagonist